MERVLSLLHHAVCVPELMCGQPLKGSVHAIFYVNTQLIASGIVIDSEERNPVRRLGACQRAAQSFDWSCGGIRSMRSLDAARSSLSHDLCTCKVERNLGRFKPLKHCQR